MHVLSLSAILTGSISIKRLLDTECEHAKKDIPNRDTKQWRPSGQKAQKPYCSWKFLTPYLPTYLPTYYTCGIWLVSLYLTRALRAPCQVKSANFPNLQYRRIYSIHLRWPIYNTLGGQSTVFQVANLQYLRWPLYSIPVGQYTVSQVANLQYSRWPM